MTRNDPSTSHDAWLADFTDQMLNGEIAGPPADGPDPEMRALAGALLRLNHAFPKQELDTASVKRMQAQILKKWREGQQKSPRWMEIFRLDWLSPSRRQQYGMALAVLVIAGILVVSAPYLFSNSVPISASAGSGSVGTFIWIVLIMLGVAIAWLLRRKS